MPWKKRNKVLNCLRKFVSGGYKVAVPAADVTEIMQWVQSIPDTVYEVEDSAAPPLWCPLDLPEIAARDDVDAPILGQCLSTSNLTYNMFAGQCILASNLKSNMPSSQYLLMHHLMSNMPQAQLWVKCRVSWRSGNVKQM